MKQYWYFRYFIKVPNAGRGGEGEGRERGGKRFYSPTKAAIDY